MKKSSVILFAALILAGLGACSRESLKATYDRQATFIEGFISAQMKADTNATLVRNGSVYRLTLHDTLDRVLGQRDSLRQGGKVSLYYACYTLTGATITSSNLIATNVKVIAEQANWNLSDTLRYNVEPRVGAARAGRLDEDSRSHGGRRHGVAPLAGPAAVAGDKLYSPLSRLVRRTQP